MVKTTGTELATVEETATAIEVSNAPKRLSAFKVGDLSRVKGIYVPPIPVSARADCRQGKWKLFDDPVEGDVTMSILKIEALYGAFSPAYDPAETMQIWFVAESGPLPADTVMVTYIKERSLTAFKQLVAKLMAEKKDPDTGIFIPKFQSYSGIVSENGKATTVNYYGLTWKWEPRTDAKREAELIAVQSSQENQLKMIDSSIMGRFTLLGEQPDTTANKELTADDF